jgi:hypothetical protein
MSCGGSHLEFPIGMKKTELGKGHSNDYSDFMALLLVCLLSDIGNI